jgi:hypothetical protein
MQLFAEAIRQHGVVSLFTRGLGTKIIINGIQSMVFTVMFKVGQGYFDAKLTRTDAEPLDSV